MTFVDLNQWMTQLGNGETLAAQIKQQVAHELPAFIRDLDPSHIPKRIKLPTGESLGDATRMTALKCHCVLLARKVHGTGFAKVASEYEALAKDLLFFVMRHHFNTNDPKGVFCCPACTLSLLPLYALGCFRWVNCDELTEAVLDSMTHRKSVFRRSSPKLYAQWAAGFMKP